MSNRQVIGERLREERKRLGLTQGEFAQKAGYSPNSQSNYEKGERAPDAEYLSAAAAHGVDVLYVLTGQRVQPVADAPHVVIPVYRARAAAGDGAVNDDESEHEAGGQCVARAWLVKRGLSPANLRIIEIKGSSMEGKLFDGDRALTDISDTQPRTGYVYILRQGDELLAKYCQLLPHGILRVSSENPAYPPYDVDLSKSDDMAIVGRVVATVHEW